MGFVGNAVKKVFKTVGLAEKPSNVETTASVGASVAPVEENIAKEGESNNKLRKRKKGKAALLVPKDSNITGGTTGINI